MRTEIPGGFSPEEAQELLDNLGRSHISKALSGERMAARDRYAELAWIRQQLGDAAWFVRATLEAHGTSVGNESPSALPETMPDIQTRELVMLIKRLASSLKAVKPDSSVVRAAQDWLCDGKLGDITDILRGTRHVYFSQGHADHDRFISGVVWRSCGVSSALAGIRKSPADPLLPGHAGHGLVGFQLCGLSVVCGLCRASIVAGLLRAGCKVR